MMIAFGPSGNADSFYEAGFKSTLEAPQYLKSLGLNAYEYSFGRGINLSQEMAEKIGEAMRRKVFICPFMRLTISI